MKRTSPLSQCKSCTHKSATSQAEATFNKVSSHIVLTKRKASTAGLFGSAVLFSAPAQALAENAESMPVVPYVLGAVSALIAVGATAAAWRLITSGSLLSNTKPKITSSDLTGVLYPADTTGVLDLDPDIALALEELTSTPVINESKSISFGKIESQEQIMKDNSALFTLPVQKKSIPDIFKRSKKRRLDASDYDTWIDSLVDSMYGDQSNIENTLVSSQVSNIDPIAEQMSPQLNNTDNSTGEFIFTLKDPYTSSDFETAAFLKISIDTPTEEFMAQNQRNLNPDNTHISDYVAPVVGPRYASLHDIEHHLEALDASNEPAAIAIREKNQQFRAEHPRQGTPTAAMIPDVMQAQKPIKFKSDTKMFTSIIKRGQKEKNAYSDVPTIARGKSVRNIVVPEIDIPEQYYAPVSYTVQKADIHANDTTNQAETVFKPNTNPSVTAAVAAAYANAAYGNVPVHSNIISFEQARPDLSARSARVMQMVNNAIPQKPEPQRITSNDINRDDAINAVAASAMWSGDAIAAVPVDDTTTDFNSIQPDTQNITSSDYIERLVQDEFEHRHETPAQRNATLGQMKVIDTGVMRPVPLDAGFKHLRHRA